MFYYLEQRCTIYNALIALSIDRWILSNISYFYRNIYMILYGTLRVRGVYGYYVVVWDTDHGPADLGYQPVCLLIHMLDL